MEINLFKPIYNNLEKEIIELTNYIHFNESQNKVYSIKICELILRVVSEIENISKSLCDNENITFHTKNKKGRKILKKQVKLHEYLNKLEPIFDLSKKAVIFKFNNFHYEIDEIYPFEKVKTKGGEERNWHYAYNKLKHDRVKNYKLGNLKNLIEGMSALFLLNIYFQNKKYTTNEDNYNSIMDSIKSNSILFNIEYAIFFNEVEKLQILSTNKINENRGLDNEWLEALINSEKIKEKSSVYLIKKDIKEFNEIMANIDFIFHKHNGGTEADFDFNRYYLHYKYAGEIIKNPK